METFACLSKAHLADVHIMHLAFCANASTAQQAHASVALVERAVHLEQRKISHVCPKRILPDVHIMCVTTFKCGTASTCNSRMNVELKRIQFAKMNEKHVLHAGRSKFTLGPTSRNSLLRLRGLELVVKVGELRLVGDVPRAPSESSLSAQP